MKIIIKHLSTKEWDFLFDRRIYPFKSSKLIGSPLSVISYQIEYVPQILRNVFPAWTTDLSLLSKLSSVRFSNITQRCFKYHLNITSVSSPLEYTP